MKANELMVGDWVRIVDDDTDEIYETKVAGISGNLGNIYAPIPEYGETAYPFSEDCVEPIPLTPEILEKNGVVKPKLSLWWLLDTPFRNLWLAQHTDGSWWLYSSDDCDKDENFAEIRYVHELQHALRLCGIEEDIEL